MIILIFLVYSILMVSAKSLVEKPDCESENAILKVLNCTSTLLDMNDFSETHQKDYDQMKMYLEDCEDFLSCEESYKCQDNKNYTKDIKRHKAKCIANIPTLKDFRECEVKLRATNSTCYQEYNPFSEDEMIQKMVKVEKEDCGKLFGEDDCMIKETMDTCGKKQGQRYQRELRNLAKAFKICKMQ